MSKVSHQKVNETFFVRELVNIHHAESCIFDTAQLISKVGFLLNSFPGMEIPTKFNERNKSSS